MIKILIVDDSAVIRRQLKLLLEQDSELQVIGEASNGEDAIDSVMRLRPDVITMDVSMPGIDGYQATRAIMELFPTPIVIITATLKEDAVNAALKSVEAGAIACLGKPAGLGDPSKRDREVTELIRTVKAMAGVRVIRRRRSRKSPMDETTWGSRKTATMAAPTRVEAVVIGGSTGAPPVLHGILKSLPGDFSLPILVVQHIAPGFLPGMARWLNQDTELDIQIAEHGQTLRGGQVYIAPDDHHMVLQDARTIGLTQTPKEYGMRPAASVLFRSAAQHLGAGVAAILLTGMGKDGAAEMGEIKRRGGETIVQDRESCVVFGMPGEALRLKVVDRVLSPAQIVATLTHLATQQPRG